MRRPQNRGKINLVKPSELGFQMLCDLVDYSTHANIAERFVLELTDFGTDAIKAAWLLELLRARDGVYQPPPIRRFELASADHTLLFAAKKLVQGNSEILNCSPTYWHDTNSKLGIS